MLRYPSILIGATFRPLSWRSLASDEEKIPLPRPLMTVPTTIDVLVMARAIALRASGCKTPSLPLDWPMLGE